MKMQEVHFVKVFIITCTVVLASTLKLKLYQIHFFPGIFSDSGRLG